MLGARGEVKFPVIQFSSFLAAVTNTSSAQPFEKSFIIFCCGSGGVYNIQKPENSREILAGKSAFLNEAVGNPVILATSNHVCMMQWNSAKSGGLVKRPFDVKHVIQLLDPGESF